MPLRSWRVVRSGARNGGFWFHVGCSRSSSVLDGRFMAGNGGGDAVYDLFQLSSQEDLGIWLQLALEKKFCGDSCLPRMESGLNVTLTGTNRRISVGRSSDDFETRPPAQAPATKVLFRTLQHLHWRPLPVGLGTNSTIRKHTGLHGGFFPPYFPNMLGDCNCNDLRNPPCTLWTCDQRSASTERESSSHRKFRRFLGWRLGSLAWHQVLQRPG